MHISKNLLNKQDVQYQADIANKSIKTETNEISEISKNILSSNEQVVQTSVKLKKRRIKKKKCTIKQEQLASYHAKYNQIDIKTYQICFEEFLRLKKSFHYPQSWQKTNIQNLLSLGIKNAVELTEKIEIFSRQSDVSPSLVEFSTTSAALLKLLAYTSYRWSTTLSDLEDYEKKSSRYDLLYKNIGKNYLDLQENFKFVQKFVNFANLYLIEEHEYKAEVYSILHILVELKNKKEISAADKRALSKFRNETPTKNIYFKIRNFLNTCESVPKNLDTSQKTCDIGIYFTYTIDAKIVIEQLKQLTSKISQDDLKNKQLMNFIGELEDLFKFYEFASNSYPYEIVFITPLNGVRGVSNQTLFLKQKIEKLEKIVNSFFEKSHYTKTAYANSFFNAEIFHEKLLSKQLNLIDFFTFYKKFESLFADLETVNMISKFSSSNVAQQKYINSLSLITKYEETYFTEYDGHTLSHQFQYDFLDIMSHPIISLASNHVLDTKYLDLFLNFSSSINDCAAEFLTIALENFSHLFRLDLSFDQDIFYEKRKDLDKYAKLSTSRHSSKIPGLNDCHLYMNFSCSALYNIVGQTDKYFEELKTNYEIYHLFTSEMPGYLDVQMKLLKSFMNMQFNVSHLIRLISKDIRNRLSILNFTDDLEIVENAAQQKEQLFVWDMTNDDKLYINKIKSLQQETQKEELKLLTKQLNFWLKFYDQLSQLINWENYIKIGNDPINSSTEVPESAKQITEIFHQSVKEESRDQSIATSEDLDVNSHPNLTTPQTKISQKKLKVAQRQVKRKVEVPSKFTEDKNIITKRTNPFNCSNINDSRKLIKFLKSYGFKELPLSRGNGSHLMMEKDNKKVVIPHRLIKKGTRNGILTQAGIKE